MIFSRGAALSLRTASALAIFAVNGFSPSEPLLAQPPSRPKIASGASTADKKNEDAPKANAPAGPVLQTRLGDVPVFPADNPWNQDISRLPVHARSRDYIHSIGADKPLFPCFGADYRGAPNGIPYVVVPADQPKQSISFEYPDESDPGPYPIPPNPLIEGGPNADADSDRHVILIDAQNKKLYELFHVLPNGPGQWKAGSGAIFDLTSNNLRPLGWTSADAAGLPIFPGLVRYDEVQVKQEIRHALRFTVRRTQRAYILPATHFASRSKDPNLPPMGLRIRLKADYDISKFPKSAQVILTALKKYGMFLADNGSDWFITGEPDNRWNDDDLHTLKRVKGHDLECLDTGKLHSE
ncbi:MAG TPA: hypothetical protein VK137_04570 [Planctomycetaceae bacterium]|nr:hypothetical protein [Planctomycetaceae bacterium]